MTTSEAVSAVLNAGSLLEASNIRNAIAMEARDGQRPEADADEVRRAFHARWSDAVRQAGRIIKLDTSGKSWTGD